MTRKLRLLLPLTRLVAGLTTPASGATKRPKLTAKACSILMQNSLAELLRSEAHYVPEIVDFDTYGVADRKDRGELVWYWNTTDRIAQGEGAQLTEDQILENLGNVVKLMVFCLHWQFQRGANPTLSSVFEFLAERLKAALQTEKYPKRKIFKSLSEELGPRIEGKDELSVPLQNWNSFIDRSEEFLGKFQTAREVKYADQDIETLHATFLLSELAHQILGALAPAHLIQLPLPQDLQRRAASTRLVRELKPPTSKSAVFQEGSDKGQAVVQLAILNLNLLSKIIDWSGWPENLTNKPIFQGINGLKSIQAKLSEAQFKHPNEYLEASYIQETSSPFEQVLVRSIFKERYFKKTLFENSKFNGLTTEQLTSWINFVEPKHVRFLLEAASHEIPRMRQTIDQRLFESVGCKLRALLKPDSLINYYADDVWQTLASLSSDESMRFGSQHLRNLAASQNKLQARFYSRFPSEMNLSLKSDDRTAQAVIGSAGWLKLFANPYSQIATFSIAGTLIAKAYLNLYGGEDEPILLMETLEVSPTFNIGQRRQGELNTYLHQILSELHRLAKRMGHVLLVSTRTNNPIAQSFFLTLPETKREISVHDRKLEKSDMATLLTKLTGLPFPSDAAQSLEFASSVNGTSVREIAAQGGIFDFEETDRLQREEEHLSKRRKELDEQWVRWRREEARIGGKLEFPEIPADSSQVNPSSDPYVNYILKVAVRVTLSNAPLLLGLEPGAALELIEQRYQGLVAVYDPARFVDLQSKDLERLKEFMDRIHRAYEFLLKQAQS